MMNIVNPAITKFISLNSSIINPYKRKLEKETCLNIVITMLFILIASQQIFPIIIPFDTIQGYYYYGERKYPSKLTLINDSADSITIDSIKMVLPFQCEEVLGSQTRLVLDSTDNVVKGYTFSPYDTVTLSKIQLIIWVSVMPPFQCSSSGTMVRDSNIIVPMILYLKNSNDTVYIFGRIGFMTPDKVIYTSKKSQYSLGSSISETRMDLSGRKILKDNLGVIISNNKKKVVVRGQ
jgi:hypothetical protein